ncbi:hypothetical protein JKP88DRAFT_255412 [Tribonema minus]|uniref:Uncharacterized protein n=1 Tax=Tribonema minus TaxID=303371 RepID=A0A836CGD1_9STRA|nr:hypothetical protein JKP88DRAFT_255412 [Tribonema minus]
MSQIPAMVAFAKSTSRQSRADQTDAAVTKLRAVGAGAAEASAQEESLQAALRPFSIMGGDLDQDLLRLPLRYEERTNAYALVGSAAAMEQAAKGDHALISPWHEMGPAQQIAESLRIPGKQLWPTAMVWKGGSWTRAARLVQSLRATNLASTGQAAAASGMASNAHQDVRRCVIVLCCCCLALSGIGGLDNSTQLVHRCVRLPTLQCSLDAIHHWGC